jgi:hypothetical protein
VKVLIYFIIASMQISAVDQGSIPSPPFPAHHRNPEWRTVQTTYQCEDGARTFSIRYHANGVKLFEWGVRKGVALSPGELDKTRRAIEKLDSVSSIYPQCSPESDSLIVFGVIGDRRHIVTLTWSPEGVTASGPTRIR